MFFPEQEKDRTLFSGGRTDLRCTGPWGGRGVGGPCAEEDQVDTYTRWVLRPPLLLPPPPPPSEPSNPRTCPGRHCLADPTGTGQPDKKPENPAAVPSETAWPDLLMMSFTVNKRLSWARGFTPGFRFILKYEQNSKGPQTSGGISTLTIGPTQTNKTKGNSGKTKLCRKKKT